MINDVIKLMIKAGDEIMKIYDSENNLLSNKKDNSPLTLADLKSDKTIKKELKKISRFPIISEESLLIHYRERKKWDKYWLIDPLDGTKDFLSKSDEFAINIALIENNKPSMGLIYIPVKRDIYFAELNNSAFKNGKKIYNSPKRKKNIVATISNFHESERMKYFLNINNIKDVVKCGSSIKFCKLAEGEVDVYPRLYGSSEWDTAAGDILVAESGCTIIDVKTKKKPNYNKLSLRNNDFIAFREDLNLII